MTLGAQATAHGPAMPRTFQRWQFTIQGVIYVTMRIAVRHLLVVGAPHGVRQCGRRSKCAILASTSDASNGAWLGLQITRGKRSEKEVRRGAEGSRDEVRPRH